jgi:hypothetical protein
MSFLFGHLLSHWSMALNLWTFFPEVWSYLHRLSFADSLWLLRAERLNQAFFHSFVIMEPNCA